MPGDAVTLWTLKLDDNDLGLTRLRNVYGELRKAMGRTDGQEADFCRRLGALSRRGRR